MIKDMLAHACLFFASASNRNTILQFKVYCKITDDRTAEKGLVPLKCKIIQMSIAGMGHFHD
jgi:hypothetical protein